VGNYELVGQELKASIWATGKGNPVQPLVVPVKAGGGGSKVVVSTRLVSTVAPKTSLNESREECSIINPEKCECVEAAVAGVEICFAPRERVSQTDPAVVSHLQAPSLP
jgi:hypothetical protein